MNDGHLTLGDEARALRAVLDRMMDVSGTSLTGIALDAAEASAAVRTFWRTVGWTERARPWVAHPDGAAGRRHVRQLLREFRAADAQFSLDERDLPARYRLVQDDGNGIGFVITDETDGDDDPPVRSVIADRRAVLTVDGRYLGWCANQLVRFAASSMVRAFLQVVPATVMSAVPSRTPYLSGAVRELVRERVYTVPEGPLARGEFTEGRVTLAAVDFASLVSFLGEAPMSAVSLRLIQGSATKAVSRLNERAMKEAELRVFAGAADGTETLVGTMRGAPIAIARAGDQCDVYHASADEERVAPLWMD